MAKENFDREAVVLSMAALKLIIKHLVEGRKRDSQNYSTRFIASLYGCDEQQLGDIFADMAFAMVDEDGNVFFNVDIAPNVMGHYDERQRTFLWTAVGFDLATKVLGDAGVYPGDSYIKAFIGNEDPMKILAKLKSYKDKNGNTRYSTNVSINLKTF